MSIFSTSTIVLLPLTVALTEREAYFKMHTVKHINSFIIARLERKLRKSFENLLSASWVLGLEFNS